MNEIDMISIARVLLYLGISGLVVSSFIKYREETIYKGGRLSRKVITLSDISMLVSFILFWIYEDGTIMNILGTIWMSIIVLVDIRKYIKRE